MEKPKRNTDEEARVIKLSITFTKKLELVCYTLNSAVCWYTDTDCFQPSTAHYTQTLRAHTQALS
jgi:hypothetical protein